MHSALKFNRSKNAYSAAENTFQELPSVTCNASKFFRMISQTNCLCYCLHLPLSICVEFQ